MTTPVEDAKFPEPGDLFEGRYRIKSLIGKGGFARVFLAVQEDLEREVALKVMLPEETREKLGANDDHRLVDRFLREARLVAKLRDPHTITMHDHGESDNGLLYMVFEYINGISLSRLIRHEGPLHPRRVIKILKQVLSSLQEAHSMGVLHRDIKPSNIMVFEHVGRRDQVKVLDFGIAKMVGEVQNQAQDLTNDGALVGTPRYMSPEQIKGVELTPQSDIYSLGLVAYEMLMGQKAIDSNSSVIIIGRQLDDVPFEIPPSGHVPENLRVVINKMLAKDLRVRYRIVDEVLEDLGALDTGLFDTFEVPARAGAGASSDSMEFADPSSQQIPDISGLVEPMSVAEDDDPTARRRLIAAAVGAFVLVALVGAVTYVAVGPGDSTAMTETAPPASVEASEKPSAEEEGPEAPEIARMVVLSQPPGATILIDGVEKGPSPVRLEADTLEFPLEVTGRNASGQTKTLLVPAMTSSISIDLTDLEPAEAPEEEQESVAMKEAEAEKEDEQAAAAAAQKAEREREERRRAERRERERRRRLAAERRRREERQRKAEEEKQVEDKERAPSLTIPALD